MADLGLAMLLTALATPGVADVPPSKRCATPATKTAAPPVVAMRKLGDEPPATHIYAVDHRVAGCPEPIVLRNGIGGTAPALAPDVRTVPRMHRLR